VIELTEADDGRVIVDMGAPVFELDAAFRSMPTGLTPVPAGATPDHLWQLWPLDLKPNQTIPAPANPAPSSYGFGSGAVDGQPARGAAWWAMWTRRRCSTHGPLIERHPAFANRVNAGFLQVVSRSRSRPPARVRARRRRNAGLRHRRLRRGGGGHPPRAARPPCRRADARAAQLTIEWAGGMPDGTVLHDRPRHHRVSKAASTFPNFPETGLKRRQNHHANPRSPKTTLPISW
jgi:diaminopimelate epimerase